MTPATGGRLSGTSLRTRISLKPISTCSSSFSMTWMRPMPLREVERLILLLARDVALRDARRARSMRGRRLLLPHASSACRRRARRRSCLMTSAVSLISSARMQVALPELERPALDGRLIGERAEDEAAVRLEVVVLEELVAAFEREVGAVDEVFVEAVALRVDVVDFVPVLAVDDEHDVRQRVGLVGVDARQPVELGARASAGASAALRRRPLRGFAQAWRAAPRPPWRAAARPTRERATDEREQRDA